MDKYKEFYKRISDDVAARKEFAEIFLKYNSSDTPIQDASAETFNALEPLAEKLGFHITSEEAIEYFQGERQLEESELDAVAGGGKGDHDIYYDANGNVTSESWG
ncbi:MAG: hypothetical protein Q4D16_08350 [Eubacteriales bacterium]|nr:hypothetical protein [Eubacteriales bacterium]